MLEIQGRYTSAKIMIDDVEEEALSQIYKTLNHPFLGENPLVIQPDTHAGAGCVVGYTQKMGKYICPNIIGVDIGCSVTGYHLDIAPEDLNFAEIDNFIRANIPHGFSVNNNPEPSYRMYAPNDLYNRVTKLADKLKLDTGKVHRAIGSLGGGKMVATE